MIFGIRIFSGFLQWVMVGDDRWKDVPVVWVHAGTEFRYNGPITQTVIIEVIEEGDMV